MRVDRYRIAAKAGAPAQQSGDVKYEERCEKPADHGELYRNGINFEPLDGAKSAQQSDASDGDQQDRHNPVYVEFLVEPGRLQHEMGEQVEIVGNRYEIGECENELGEPFNRQDRASRVAVFQQRLDMRDVFADRRPDQVGDDQKNGHRDDRPAAHHIPQNRNRNEKTAADDRCERRACRAPDFILQKAGTHQYDQKPDKHCDGDVTVHFRFCASLMLARQTK